MAPMEDREGCARWISCLGVVERPKMQERAGRPPRIETWFLKLRTERPVKQNTLIPEEVGTYPNQGAPMRSVANGSLGIVKKGWSLFPSRSTDPELLDDRSEQV